MSADGTPGQDPGVGGTTGNGQDIPDPTDAGDPHAGEHGRNGANGAGHPEEDPFGDDQMADDAADEEAQWRADLPTTEEVKKRPLSVYEPAKLAALAKLRRANHAEFLDLVRNLATATKDRDLTAPKIKQAVKEFERQQKQQAREQAEDAEADENVAVQILGWLDKFIACRFIDTYRRPFIDYRDPSTAVFTCRPVLHDDVRDLINTCPILKVAPPEAVVSAVVRTIEGQARRSHNVRKVFVRRGWHERVLYVDRAAPDGSVIKVDETGWKVIPLDQCPVRFQYDISMAELPVPVSGGSIDTLWKFVRVPRTQDRNVTSGFVIGCYAPHGPFSGLGIYGQFGSAKSITMELLASLIDPSRVSPGKMSDSEESSLIHAQRAALLPYDNLTGLSDDQANTLCRIVQGAGFRTRLLYTNSGEAVLNAELPVIANGITQFIVRPDLADRFATITLERIPEDERNTRQQIRDEFEKVCPQLFGVIFSAISTGLARTDFKAPNKLPRLADHAVWVSRCERGLGLQDGDYIRALAASAQTAARDAVEADVLGVAIVEMQARRAGDSWANTPEKTLAEINLSATERVKRGKEWPQNASWLTRRLKPLIPLLAALGIDVTLDTRIDTAEAENRRGILIEGRLTPTDDTPTDDAKTGKGKGAGDTKTGKGKDAGKGKTGKGSGNAGTGKGSGNAGTGKAADNSENARDATGEPGGTSENASNATPAGDTGAVNADVPSPPKVRTTL